MHPHVNVKAVICWFSGLQKAAPVFLRMLFLAPIGAFLIALLITLGANGFGLLRCRATEKAHWTERARKLYPMRRSAALNIWLIPVICVLVEWLVFPARRNVWLVLAVAIAGWVGAILGTYPWDKKLF